MIDCDDGGSIISMLFIYILFKMIYNDIFHGIRWIGLWKLGLATEGGALTLETKLGILLDEKTSIEPKGPDTGDWTANAITAKDDLTAMGFKRAIFEGMIGADDMATAIVRKTGNQP